jgi:Ca-activated chloride channel family protein
VRLPLISAFVAALALPDPGAVRAIAQQGSVYRSGIDLVNMGVTVTDRRGQLVTDLARNDFVIYEDGVRQEILHFAAGNPSSDAPDLHLGILLDVSRSMVDELSFTRTASIRFLSQLPDAVDITVVDFDTEVRVARFGQLDFPRVVERIRQQRVRGSTALYDAIGLYLDSAFGQTGRKVMLVYTDGSDTRSALRWSELVDLLQASDVTVYAIGAFRRGQHVAADRTLQQVASLTGGRAFFPSSLASLDAIYEQVLAEMRAQYLLGYLSTNTSFDGSWRKVEIQIEREAGPLRLRSRKGYYALYKDAAH